MAEVVPYDVVVVGAGSGGFAAALAAARGGCRVLVIEHAGAIGGNANRCGVNNWEPVAGATGFPREIYTRLQRIPQAVAVYGFARHCVWGGLSDGPAAFPGGEHRIRPGRSYDDTLVRHGFRSLRDDGEFVRNHLFGVVFEPAAYEAVLWQMLGETGRVTVRLNCAVAAVETDAGTARSVAGTAQSVAGTAQSVAGTARSVGTLTLSDGSRVVCRTVIDATGDAELCRLAGCELVSGQESRAAYNEPSAPSVANNRVNAVTLMFRITPKDSPSPDDPTFVAGGCSWADHYPVVSVVEYPNGDRNVNMLPTMEGREYLNQPHEKAYAECRRRVFEFWNHLQRVFPEFQGFTIHSLSPDIGVRESYRVVCERVLTEHDIRAGISRDDADAVIAIADHAMDRHGEKGGAVELDQPFGIFFDCLIPRGFGNLLIACRAAGFSSIAASSCRLSRTMMQLGQAAGTAAALAQTASMAVSAVDRAAVRRRLRADGVRLE